MSKIDGRELLRSLCRDGNWIPIILLTQVGKAFKRVMVLEEGINDLITNPSNPTNWKLKSRLFCEGQGQEIIPPQHHDGLHAVICGSTGDFSRATPWRIAAFGLS